jgi:hypothetical protein
MSASVSPEMPQPTTRKGRGRRMFLIALVVVVVLALLGAVAAFFVAPRLCGLTEPERHGLSCDIPLPSGARFTNQPALPQSPGITTEAWAFTVPGEQAHSVAQVYSQRLPGAGWRCVTASVLADLPQNSQEHGAALNGNRGLSVTVIEGPPDNVTRLLIAVSTFPQTPPGAC